MLNQNPKQTTRCLREQHEPNQRIYSSKLDYYVQFSIWGFRWTLVVLKRTFAYSLYDMCLSTFVTSWYNLDANYVRPDEWWLLWMRWTNEHWKMHLYSLPLSHTFYLAGSDCSWLGPWTSVCSSVNEQGTNILWLHFYFTTIWISHQITEESLVCTKKGWLNYNHIGLINL